LENLNAIKQAINDKLQGSAATKLTFGVNVYNQIKKGLLPSLPVKKMLKIGEYFGNVTSNNMVVSCTLFLATTLLKQTEKKRRPN